jgi:predicted nucleic acid-binding protein
VIVVADTGPLLSLAKIGALDLLVRLYGEVITVPAVYDEAVTAGLALGAADAPLLEAAYQRGALRVQATAGDSLPTPGLLHQGEAKSIRLAIEQSADLLLVDDLDARQLAGANFQAAGAPTEIQGTLGVIVSAYRQALLYTAGGHRIHQRSQGAPRHLGQRSIVRSGYSCIAPFILSRSLYTSASPNRRSSSLAARPPPAGVDPVSLICTLLVHRL